MNRYFKQITIFILMILPLLSAGLVTALEITLTMVTDKQIYTTADTITITGIASPVAAGHDVSVIVRDPSGSIWAIGQISPALSGDWSIANINVFTSSTTLGRYTATATYQGKTVSTNFNVTAPIQITLTFATDKLTYTASDTITITGTASPVAAGRDVSVSINRSDGSIWSLGQSTPISSGDWKATAVLNVDSAIGIYTVTASYQGKTVSTTFKVEQGSKAKIDGPYPSSPKVKDAISFEPHIEGKRTPYDFSWDFGDGQKTIFQNPTWYPESAGIFTVKMEATDPFGNKVSAIIIVKVS
ncbi:MAG TPA: PKD domain-containing protein [Nitrososphaerales archaeon]